MWVRAIWWRCPGVVVLTTSTLTLVGWCCRHNPGVDYFAYFLYNSKLNLFSSIYNFALVA
jgi:hypothetical protein